MTAALWLRDLFAYSVQLALVVAAGFLLASLFRLRSPRVRLGFAQGLLGLALLLPWLQPWKVILEQPARVEVETRTLEPAAATAFDATDAVAALLLGGSLFRLALLGRRLRRLRGYRRLSRRLDGSAAVADAWQRDAWQRVGVRAPVYASAEIGVPAAFGALRPVVLVPEHFMDLDPAAQRAVLCHELLHVRRQDWLQMIGEELAGAVLWFHPALWWVIARIRVAREQVVDEAAVRLTRERRAYLETLVGMARMAAARTVAPAALFLTESHLKGRVDVLLREVSMSKKASSSSTCSSPRPARCGTSR
jgi:beta-lactamase regulating signal transducer with metallopeptidase domain